MNDRDIHSTIRILRREVPKWDTPIVTLMAETYESPFRVLISCVLSLRTRIRLRPRHRIACLPSPTRRRPCSKLTAKRIEKLIFPVGFYKTKAKNILEICRTLIDRLRRRGSRRDRRTAEAQRRRTQDGQFGRHPWIQKTRHLRRHPRASDLESLGLRQHQNAGKDRICPAR